MFGMDMAGSRDGSMSAGYRHSAPFLPFTGVPAYRLRLKDATAVSRMTVTLNPWLCVGSR